MRKSFAWVHIGLAPARRSTPRSGAQAVEAFLGQGKEESTSLARGIKTAMSKSSWRQKPKRLTGCCQSRLLGNGAGRPRSRVVGSLARVPRLVWGDMRSMKSRANASLGAKVQADEKRSRVFSAPDRRHDRRFPIRMCRATSSARQYREGGRRRASRTTAFRISDLRQAAITRATISRARPTSEVQSRTPRMARAEGLRGAKRKVEATDERDQLRERARRRARAGRARQHRRLCAWPPAFGSKPRSIDIDLK